MNSISSLGEPNINLARSSTPAADAERLKAVATQFEAMLLAGMMRQMRESAWDDGEKTGFGGGPLGETIEGELGLALSRAGGVGLGAMLGQALSRQIAKYEQPAVMELPQGNDAPTSVESADAQPAIAEPVVATPSEALAPAGPSAPAGRVSSAFGWRRDPLDGTSRFHRGTDLPMPVGTDVAAAADGVVSFVGQQTGYGLTVTVTHPGGTESRYGHLSASQVRVGESVARGQAIAKSGNSGRSTGPHLHFEVLQDGVPVDPSRH